MYREIFKDAKIGDHVWDTRFGWGKIYMIHKSNLCPLKVKFDTDYSIKREYRFDGKIKESDVMPRLFWNEFEVPNEAYIKRLPQLDVDTKVLVWDENGDFNQARKHKRYFSHFSKDGIIYCFEQGRTSWSATTTQAWTNWELYEIN